MSFSLDGKTAIITGAANGVGLEIARHFSDQGANVMLVDRDEDKLAEEAESIAGGAARYFAGDLREKLTIANLLSATIDAFDSVDILVNAARQVLPSNPLDAREDHVEELIQQNVLTTLRVTQAVARRMIAQAEDADPDAQAGAIVNLSSIAAERTHPELLGYSVSTAALNQLTRSLAVALAPERIRVNAIAIGSVMSASLEARLREEPAMRNQTVRVTPMGRIAEAREVAEAAQFLATSASRFVTGQVLTVDGGRSLIDPLAPAAH